MIEYYILKHKATGLFLKRNYVAKKCYVVDDKKNLIINANVLTNKLQKARVWVNESCSKWFFLSNSLYHFCKTQVRSNFSYDELRSLSRDWECIKIEGIDLTKIKKPNSHKDLPKEKKLKFYSVKCKPKYSYHEVTYFNSGYKQEKCHACGVRLIEIPYINVDGNCVCFVCLQNAVKTLEDTYKPDLKWLEYVKHERFLHNI
ncbi:MAG: hypothetical protein ACFFKA_00660 [Candidatus Thorarchaeota archaeon]